jgi:hypothetical protein
MKMDSFFMLLVSCGAAVYYDDFRAYNTSLWEYADGMMVSNTSKLVLPFVCTFCLHFLPAETMGTTDGCKVWYLKNHSQVGATLSKNEGQGLKMVMSSQPCKSNPAACKVVETHSLKHLKLLIFIITRMPRWQRTT